jgi:bifunctional ADP-heptose synthase (sugar kinase/adenylyltransferase)
MKILVIGDSCTDVFIYGKVDKLCPEAPVPVLVPHRTVKNGGMAANVYGNIQSMGVDVDLITNEEEVTKTRFIEENTNHQIVRVDSQTSKNCRIQNLESIDFSQYCAVIISDYNKGFLEYDDIEYICKSNPVTFIDTKKVINDKMLFAKYIKINEYEYQNNLYAGQDFIKFNGKLIVTNGNRGCTYMGKNYPVPKVEIKDISGAGDTFISALVVEYCKTNDLDKSIIFANECATIVVQQKGVTQVGNFIKR